MIHTVGTLGLHAIATVWAVDAPSPPEPAAGSFRQDVPMRPPEQARVQTRPQAVGAPVTLFVNFDGVKLSRCNPGNSKRNCTWYNYEKPFEPYSGDLQQRIAILQAMRQDVADFGIRVTAVRPPPTLNYTMVVYGGTEEDYGDLGSAPSGDCGDRSVNDIAFAHVDGALAEWVNGGATTALHEAAHTWGLDHTNRRGTIMFPSGDNRPTAYGDACDPIVADTRLTPATEVSCPEINEMLCGDANLQNAYAELSWLFGPPYVDVTPPVLALREPTDGAYFQGPATFDVLIEVHDDLAPQPYDVWIWLDDEARPAESRLAFTPDFTVRDLPNGEWTFHVAVADEAGNASQLDFEIVVGDDPPPAASDDEAACACHESAARPGAAALLLPWVLVGVPRRRGGVGSPPPRR